MDIEKANIKHILTLPPMHDILDYRKLYLEKRTLRGVCCLEKNLDIMIHKFVMRWKFYRWESLSEYCGDFQ